MKKYHTGIGRIGRVNVTAVELLFWNGRVIGPSKPDSQHHSTIDQADLMQVLHV
jgi:hypothetical protein